MVIGPPQGYLPEPTKSILIVSPRNVPRAEAIFWRYGLQIVTGGRYLGDLVSTKAAQDHFLGDKVEGWQDSVENLARVARRHPQTAFAGLQKSLHQEWSFVQHVTIEIEVAYQVVEYAMRDTFLPALFQGATAQIPGRVITGLLSKQDGIAFHNPTRTAGANWMAS